MIVAVSESFIYCSSEYDVYEFCWGFSDWYNENAFSKVVFYNLVIMSCAIRFNVVSFWICI